MFFVVLQKRQNSYCLTKQNVFCCLTKQKNVFLLSNKTDRMFLLYYKTENTSFVVLQNKGKKRFCCLTKETEFFFVVLQIKTECFKIPEERKLILFIYHKSSLQALQINDVTLIILRPFSLNQRRKQHQKLVYYVPK